MTICYDAPDRAGWVVRETEFRPEFQAKFETIFSQGNGYLGVRAATEEKYVEQTRNLFVNGTFNKFDEDEVTELPNIADFTNIEILVDGERMTLTESNYQDYERRLDIETGELKRSFVWSSKAGKRVRFEFKRFASYSDKHLCGLQVQAMPIDSRVVVRFDTGLDAQVTNSGAQHFHEGDKRIHDKTYLELSQSSTESQVDIISMSTHDLKLDGRIVDIEPALNMARRKVGVSYKLELEPQSMVELSKLCVVFTSFDADVAERIEVSSDEAPLRAIALEHLNKAKQAGYQTLFEASVAAWANVWADIGIEIEGNSFDQLAMRFAHYHMLVCTPDHDNRLGIGAKGLSGEGYKGHSFWDTEIFLLPFFIYSQPEVARSLLEYRFNTLEGARRKAQHNGYQGAMFPWESAVTGDEETPEFAMVDVVTGKPTKIWCGIIEQHITADIAYAVWQYFKITGDEDFMQRCGYQLLFETATFWTSRLEWLEEKSQWGILDVIGPDEYKEHVDNNAYTNYMAHFNIETAISFFEKLDAAQPELITSLDQKIDVVRQYQLWKEKVGQIYLPQVSAETGILPQDDTYLSKPHIDLSPYKDQEKVALIFNDYNFEQVSDMQVSKQADVLVLMMLLEHQFGRDVKQANWDFYEPRTLHDSSLSYAIHSVVASDIQDTERAYELFNKAANIDLGPKMKSSDLGMHIASLGGIWQCVVYGFGGVRMVDGQLRINPALPKAWSKLRFPIHWQGERLDITLDSSSIKIQRDSLKPLDITLNNQPVTLLSQEETFNV